MATVEFTEAVEQWAGDMNKLPDKNYSRAVYFATSQDDDCKTGWCPMTELMLQKQVVTLDQLVDRSTTDWIDVGLARLSREVYKQDEDMMPVFADFVNAYDSTATADGSIKAAVNNTLAYWLGDK